MSKLGSPDLQAGEHVTGAGYLKLGAVSLFQCHT